MKLDISKMSRRKRLPKAKYDADARKLICNVHQFFLNEGNAGHLMIALHKVVPRVAAALKMPQTSVRQIMYEEENRCVLEVVKSIHESFVKKNAKSGGRPRKYDVTESTIRRAIYEIYRANQRASVRVLQEKLEQEGISGSMSSLYRTIKAMGFKFLNNKKDKQSIVERDDVVAQRHAYLRNVRKYRADDWDIVYINETLISPTYSFKGQSGDVCRTQSSHESHCFQTESGVKSVSTSACSTRRKLAVLDAGSVKHGFIKGAGITYLSDCDGNNPDDLAPSVTDFLNWFENHLLKNLPDPSIIVLEDKSCHNALAESSKYPTPREKKEVLKSWLDDHNISYDETFIKEELLQLVKKHRTDPVYVTDRMAMMNGHIVIRFPAKHSELNPLELIQAKHKHGVAERNDMFKISNVQKLFYEVRKTIGVDSWTKAMDDVIRIENQFWEMDNMRENASEPTAACSMIESGDGDMSDDDSCEDFSDVSFEDESD